jgi:hypothetical protein
VTEKPRVRSLDDLAIALESGAITRAKAIKLGGAALAAAALGALGAGKAEALEADRRRRCCRHRRHPHCRQCCFSPRKPCCGRHGCRCCDANEECREGRCR